MQTNANANIEYYDKMSQIYDKKHLINLDDYPLFKKQIKKLFKGKKGLYGKKILDCGCGSGRGAIKFCKMGCKVSAIDISPEITKKCYENGKKYGYRINTQAADCRSLPFDDNSFDVVSTSAALHHMEDLEKCLKEFYRVTDKGGALVLLGEPKKCTIRPDWVRAKKEELSAAYDMKMCGVKQTNVNPDVYIFDVEMLKRLIRKIGYKDIRVEYFFFLSSLYRDFLYFRITNEKLRKILLDLTRIIDTYLLFWLPKKNYALFNLAAWKE